MDYENFGFNQFTGEVIGIFVCFINVAFGTIVIPDLRKKIIAVKISDQFTYKLCLFAHS